jgi:hypothetical protein
MNPKKQPIGTLVVCLGLFFGAVPQASLAQSNAVVSSSSPDANAGLVNDWLRRQSTAFDAWDIGGQFRARFEDKSYFAVPSRHAADFQHHGDSGNACELLRERVHLGWKPIDWFEVFGEMQDSSAISDDRDPSPDKDHYTLRQAWVSLGRPKEFPLMAKAGRQELIYGDQRLIGVADWLNFGRTYDAAKVRYITSSFWVDAFVSQPVLPDLRGFDTSDSHDKLSGIYSSTRTLLLFQETQLYFLARNTDPHPAYEAAEKPAQYPLASPRDIYTIGGRAQSLPGALHGWDYGAEAAYQFGRFEAGTASPSLAEDAFAVHVAAGHSWAEMPLSPRLGAEYNYGSGDSNPTDGRHGTFDNLFPSNHGLYGIMDFFSLQNMQDLHLSCSVKPVKKLTLKLDGHAFWLATTDDYFYLGNGAPRTTGGYGIHPSYSSYVGSELDLVANYMLAGFAWMEAGFGHFFAGDYVRESLAAHSGATDANYVYAQLYFNF